MSFACPAHPPKANTELEQIYDLLQLILSKCQESNDAIAALQSDVAELVADLGEGSCASEFLDHSDEEDEGMFDEKSDDE